MHVAFLVSAVFSFLFKDGAASAAVLPCMHTPACLVGLPQAFAHVPLTETSGGCTGRIYPLHF